MNSEFEVDCWIRHHILSLRTIWHMFHSLIHRLVSIHWAHKPVSSSQTCHLNHRQFKLHLLTLLTIASQAILNTRRADVMLTSMFVLRVLHNINVSVQFPHPTWRDLASDVWLFTFIHSSTLQSFQIRKGVTSSCNMIARDNYKIIQAIFFVMLAGCSKAVGGVHLLRNHSQKYSGTLGQETNKTHS